MRPTEVSNFAQTPPGPCAYDTSFPSNLEERPMRINWEVVKPSLWTGAGGVVVGMVLLSYGFGFMSRTTAEKLANTSSERAVIAVLAPVSGPRERNTEGHLLSLRQSIVAAVAAVSADAEPRRRACLSMSGRASLKTRIISSHDKRLRRLENLPRASFC